MIIITERKQNRSNNNNNSDKKQTTMFNFSAVTLSTNVTFSPSYFPQNQSPPQQQRQHPERDLTGLSFIEDIEEIIDLVDGFEPDIDVNGSFANGSSANSSTKTFPSCQVPMFQVMIYILPVIIIVGLIGNGLSLKILSTRALKCHSARIYLKTLAFLDSCVLLTALVDWFTIFG